MSEIFMEGFVRPFYNALILILAAVPGADLGIAVIILTILVKVLILPLSKKAIESQIKMREVQPDLKKIQEKYGKNKEEVYKRTMALYKEKGVHLFSGCLPLLVQTPIVMGLYFVFYREVAANNPALLYSFVHATATIDPVFLGLIDLTNKSIILAVVAAVAQFFHTKISLPSPALTQSEGKLSFSEEFTRSMNVQMKYVFPIIVGVIAYVVSGIVALYFATSNLFSLFYELWVRRSKKSV
ncbi:MAG: hypothetical protein A2675_01545 [Candidatus Yonathbacteria bacterium RIFCSPHIGHO2_01_FULL_51_10]|uniref:Membrane insertase YidC/Oxa/ALB C-terminal domain-containing protein n=1 Tax=Candidatus Yonathbacteria bacterium RIFCSPHIGHO2_01_FULL_51_10 TaxID=1802723 RepID=A0A1G2SB88_9BACT|nr:MAG: hypothetical protein A2675_01545 [Candidatus Yonathbacteria bacterium RIFCSPHIGHO2_01_FULL_51_10]